MAYLKLSKPVMMAALLACCLSFYLQSVALAQEPSFTTTPLLTATVNLPYHYTIGFTSDVTTETITVTNQTTLPDWLELTTILTRSAMLSGTPSLADLDQHIPVNLRLINGVGLTASQQFTITVSPNLTPSITSTPPVSATEGATYTYHLTTTDPNPGDTLSFTASQKPAWLSLVDYQDGTADLSGLPDLEDVGNYGVTLTVGDSGGLQHSQSYTLTVEPYSYDPRIVSSAVLWANVGDIYTYHVEAIDPAGEALTLGATRKPLWLNFTDNGDGSGDLSGIPPLDAVTTSNTVIIGVENESQKSDFQRFEITVTNETSGTITPTPTPTNTPEPTATPPANSQTITVSPVGGGALIAKDLQIFIQPGAVTETVTLRFAYLDTMPSLGEFEAVGQAFTIEILVNGQVVDNYPLNIPATVSNLYTPTNTIITDTIRLRWFDGATWQTEGIELFDLTNFAVTSQVSHFTTFALLGETTAVSGKTVYLPLVMKSIPQSTATPTATATATAPQTTATATNTPTTPQPTSSSTATPTPPQPTATPTNTSERPTTEPPPHTPTPILPDLIVERFTVSRLDSGFYQLEVTIHNNADVGVPYGNNFYTNIYVDDLNQEPLRFWGVQASWMGAHQSRTFTAEFSADEVGAGSHTFFAWVDPYNVVQEANQNNNIGTLDNISITTHDGRKAPSIKPDDGPKPTPTNQP